MAQPKIDRPSLSFLHGERGSPPSPDKKTVAVGYSTGEEDF